LIFESLQDEIWDITMRLFGTGEVDIGTSQDELWDKTGSLIGIMVDDISIFRKVIIWKISR
jgi:hypothetical protein